MFENTKIVSETVLKELLEHCTMDTTNPVIKEMKKALRYEQVEKQHNHSIWQEESGRWNTYIDDATCNRGFKKVSRGTKENLLGVLVEYYANKQYTVRKVYEDWKVYKRKYTTLTEQSLTKYDNDFRRFFENSDIIDMPIEEVTEGKLTTFIRDNISDKKLTAKSFAGLRLLINAIFKYAKEYGKTTISISAFFNDLDLNGSFEKPLPKKKAFSVKEIQRIIEECYKYGDVISLGVALDFQLFQRIGEASCLRWNDVDFENKKIYVHCTEIMYRDPETRKYVNSPSDNRTKTEAGTRTITISDKAMETLNLLKKLTGECEFIITRNGKRVKTNSLRKKLVSLCEKAGVEYRSPHAARRTGASVLLSDKSIPHAVVQTQMGHKNIETTLKYLRDISEETEAQEMVNNAMPY